MADDALERLRDRYARGLLTCGELYAAITGAAVDLERVRATFGISDPAFMEGLATWQREAATAFAFGGEWSDAPADADSLDWDAAGWENPSVDTPDRGPDGNPSSPSTDDR